MRASLKCCRDPGLPSLDSHTHSIAKIQALETTLILRLERDAQARPRGTIPGPRNRVSSQRGDSRIFAELQEPDGRG